MKQLQQLGINLKSFFNTEDEKWYLAKGVGDGVVFVGTCLGGRVLALE